MNSPEYLQWVQDTKHKVEFPGGMTGTQAGFTEFLIKNHRLLAQFGDLKSVFESVQAWVKTRPDILNPPKNKDGVK